MFKIGSLPTHSGNSAEKPTAARWPFLEVRLELHFGNVLLFNLGVVLEAKLVAVKVFSLGVGGADAGKEDAWIVYGHGDAGKHTTF